MNVQVNTDCPQCGKTFKTRGLKRHLLYCKAAPAAAQSDDEEEKVAPVEEPPVEEPVEKPVETRYFAHCEQEEEKVEEEPRVYDK